MRHRLDPLRYGRQVWESFQDLEKLLRNLPADLRVVLRKLKAGKLHIEIEHKGLQETNDAFERGANRISLSIIIGALIVGTALVSYGMVPPLIYGIPLLGIAGFLISGFLGLRVIIGILRNKKR